MKVFFLWCTAIIFSSHLKAQWVSDSIKTYDPVIVTANKTINKQSQTGKVVTIVSKEFLQNNIGKNISEILNEQAGLFIVGANNAPGSNQDVYMRGSGKILFLLNGTPIYDASTINNAFDINSISIENI
jgi:vitamin B12 transporter